MKSYDLKEINLIHDFEKTNLVTQKGKGNRTFDAYKCKKCGIKGKRYDFTSISFENKVSDKKIKLCNSEEKEKIDLVGKKVKIITCEANGKEFINIISGTIHEIVEPPKKDAIKYPNNMFSVWVFGISEPVRLLNHEFVFLLE